MSNKQYHVGTNIAQVMMSDVIGSDEMRLFLNFGTEKMKRQMKICAGCETEDELMNKAKTLELGRIFMAEVVGMCMAATE